MNLERHIEILLLWNDCVIIPELGGFTTSHIPARLDDDNMFIPPLRTLGFNPKLNVNDSLLVQSYSETYDISYPEALKKINDEVSEIKQHIENNGEFVLNDIGTLYRTETGGIGFTPCEAGVLTPSLYGLSSFEMERLYSEATTNEQKSKTQTQTSTNNNDVVSVGQNNDNETFDSEFEEKTINIKLSVINNIAATVIAIIGFFLFTSPISNSNNQIQLSKIDAGIVSRLVNGNNDKQVVKQASRTLELKAETKQVAKENNTIKESKDKVQNTSYYCLVLASQVTNKNAKIYSERLVAKGYDETRVLDEPNKSTKVIYGCYPTEAEAYNALNELHKNDAFKEAWVYKVNKK